MHNAFNIGKMSPTFMRSRVYHLKCVKINNKFWTFDTQILASNKKCTSIDMHNLEFDM